MMTGVQVVLGEVEAGQGGGKGGVRDAGISQLPAHADIQVLQPGQSQQEGLQLRVHQLLVVMQEQGA